MNTHPAFDDDSRLVPAVDFDYGEIEPEERAARTQIVEQVRSMQNLVMIAVEGLRRDSAYTLWGACALKLGCPGWTTQREVARQLGCSEAAVSRAVKRLSIRLKTQPVNCPHQPANIGEVSAKIKKAASSPHF